MTICMYQLVTEQILCARNFCVYVSLFKDVNKNQKSPVWHKVLFQVTRYYTQEVIRVRVVHVCWDVKWPAL